MSMPSCTATMVHKIKATLNPSPKIDTTNRSTLIACRSALRRALDITEQLERHLVALGLPLRSCGPDTTPVQRALAAGLFPNAARRRPDGSYAVLATGQAVSLHPGSVRRPTAPAAVVFAGCVVTLCRIHM